MTCSQVHVHPPVQKYTQTQCLPLCTQTLHTHHGPDRCTHTRTHTQARHNCRCTWALRQALRTPRRAHTSTCELSLHCPAACSPTRLGRETFPRVVAVPGGGAPCRSVTEASETTSSPNPQPSFQRLHPAPCRTKPPFPALARAALELSNRTGWSSLAPSLRGISVSLGIWASDATVMGINRTAPKAGFVSAPPTPLLNRSCLE